MTGQQLRDMRTRIQMAANVTIPRDQFIEILDHIGDLQVRLNAATDSGEPQPNADEGKEEDDG